MVTAPAHAALLSCLNEVKPGSILHGRYLIEEPSWSGGMGGVWALGVLFCEFPTGRVPFEASGLPVPATKIAYDSPTPRLSAAVDAGRAGVVLLRTF